MTNGFHEIYSASLPTCFGDSSRPNYVSNFVGRAIHGLPEFSVAIDRDNPVPGMTASDIPDGFERHFRQSPLTDPWEPIYSKRTADAVIIGLRLATSHTNSRGLIHGGLIAALADNAMGHSCGVKLDGGGSRLVTVGLSVDFIGTAQIGQWLAVESEVIKTGGTLCFAQCLVTADGVAIARANGTFRVVKKAD
jgi:uncharacterized protein (TIGR00369 family)